MTSDDELWRQTEAARRFVETFYRSGAMQELERVVRDMRWQQAAILQPLVDSFGVFAAQAAKISSLTAALQPAIDAYTNIARGLLDGFQPAFAQVSMYQAWSTNLAPQLADISAFLSTVSAAIPPSLDEVEPAQELTSRTSLRLLTPSEMKKMFSGAAVLLGGEAALSQIIREYVGPDASPTDVLLWSAGIIFAALMLFLAATDFHTDE